MACDSMTSTADSWWPSTKVHRAGDALIGGAGEVASIRQFVKWYADGQRLPKGHVLLDIPKNVTDTSRTQ